jgi:hypothetical protein
MSKVTISKGVIETYVDVMLNTVQRGIDGTPPSRVTWEGMQEMLWRIKHYIDQGEDK